MLMNLATNAAILIKAKSMCDITKDWKVCVVATVSIVQQNSANHVTYLQGEILLSVQDATYVPEKSKLML